MIGLSPSAPLTDNEQLIEDLRRQVAALKARLAVFESEPQITREGPSSPEDSVIPAEAKDDPYRDLFEKSADAILIIDGGKFSECNQATVEMLRYETRQQLLLTHPSELSPEFQPDGRPSFEKANEMIAIAFANGSHRFEWEHKRADGDVFPVEVLLTAVPKDGHPQLHVVWRDITERKKLQNHLVQAQKMEAVGQLAGGIAHDFNNLLFAINGNAEMLLLELPPKDGELVDLTHQILRTGKRAADLTRQLLAFSRKQVLQPVVLDLHEVLLSFHDLLSRLLGENVLLTTRPASGPAMIKADLGQIEQVLINLATNARDAMPRGGELTLDVVTRLLGRSDHRVGPGEFVEFNVTDTGVGMNAEIRRQAFDPFFTTKDVGKGTGLGLATVYGIVRQSGGDIAIRTGSDSGTTITIWLPVTTEHLTELPASPPVSMQMGSETILVVEDELAVSDLMSRLLRKHGYTVLACNDGLEALDVYAERSSQIDLVISDVVMPQVGGPELISRLRSCGFCPRVIFVSGYADQALDSPDELTQDAEFLSKPVATHELLNCVRVVLDRPL